ncbi:uncharacterized protein L3040_005680 [Drepanopeziza brunnea f. sp. 'multigermtubi']|uniref:Uncharacterized protein n=1 Tax=Marssonina brunnea f. sp. multigermtubi (strain MB_m1) TaxID=1072389 RepID=K1XMM1_MARBU|nr:uncharacterized protein MBM_07900 [Drepanopeziza brunnea f. sp. 'multigermtubi' MB_m1]EKD13699.1 hypothetical protein MBM_07900 [Drepanopeziza brunnea f. sp. 'multigermtubi' MB_m1]KAJ5041127.1 hypothetical protein L3040_005680 [Drepanopeziza brunnea f. sp. 'multigermtubi']
MSAPESSTVQPNTPVPGARTPTNVPNVPLLGEGFPERPQPVLCEANGSDVEEAAGMKNGKRRLFGFGKKKEESKAKGKKKGDAAIVASSASTITFQPVPRKVPLGSSPRSHPNHPYLVSPAGSQIFERDVQESSLPITNSPAIPSHIQTENHIPPVLDASSEAITNRFIDPDTVEIVMHSYHQPAAIPASMSFPGLGGLEPSGGTGLYADDAGTHPEKDDAASNHGALESTDAPRLSFISFSDILQSEHAEHAGFRDSFYVAGLSSLSSGHNESPSPIRSPVSSQGFSSSPPTSQSASLKGIEMSPKGRPLGSPTSTHASLGELTIETMTQALRRTGSRDLSGMRSRPLSPSSPDGLSEQSFR